MGLRAEFKNSKLVGGMAHARASDLLNRVAQVKGKCWVVLRAICMAT